MPESKFLAGIKKFFKGFFGFLWRLVKAIFLGFYQLMVLMSENSQSWDENRYEGEFEKEKNLSLFGNKSGHLKTLLSLGALVIKADGKVQEAELHYIKKKFEKDYSKITAESWMMKLQVILKQEQNLDKLCKRINRSFSQSTKIQLLHFLSGIAVKDGMMTNAEFDLLKNISRRIRIPTSTLKSILALFNFISEEQFKHNQQRRSQKKESSGWELSKAYLLLEIEPSASDKAVKKAFRKLAVIHHPDKVIHMGQVFQKAAEAKFKKILDAYELIKTDRGFS